MGRAGRISAMALVAAAVMASAFLALSFTAATEDVSAATTVRDGITYDLDDVNGTAAVKSSVSGITFAAIPGEISEGGKTYTVKSIGNNAFYNRSALASVTIPDSVTSIGHYTFYGCTALTSVAIPSDVTSIGYGVFQGCTSLGAIDVDAGNTVFEASGGMLYNKSSKTLVACPAGFTGAASVLSGTTGIDGGAFYGCASLESVAIPSSLTLIGSQVFIDCTDLNAINVDAGNTVFEFSNGMLYNKSSKTLVVCLTGFTGTASIPSGTLAIQDNAFRGCASLTSVTIPDTVTYIGYGAFRGCASLTSVAIPSGVTSIDSEAFQGCSALTSVTIPDTVTSIGYYAFYGCSALTSVAIPSGATSIGNYTFYGCTSLTSVTIPDSVTYISGYVFRGCTSLGGIDVDESNTKYASYGGLLYDKGMTELIVCPAGVSGDVLMPDTVTTVREYAFFGCDKISSLKVSVNLTDFRTASDPNETKFYDEGGNIIPPTQTNIAGKTFVRVEGGFTLDTEGPVVAPPGTYGFLDTAVLVASIAVSVVSIVAIAIMLRKR